VLVILRCVRVPSPACRARQIPTASAPPCWGRFFKADSKNPCTEGAGVSNAEKFWESITRVQPSGVAACCLVNRGQCGDSTGISRDATHDVNNAVRNAQSKGR
jgi:hypothetical protein